MTDSVVATAIEHWDGLVAEDESLEDELPALREWMLERGLRISDLIDLDRRPVADGALMRLDASLARTQLHFIELNADMPQGMGHNDGLVAFFQQLDAYDRFAERYKIRPLRLEQTMLDTLLEIWSEWGRRG